MTAWALALATLIAVQDPNLDALLKGLSADAEEIRTTSANSLISLGEKAEAKVREKRAASEGETRLLCDMILGRIAWRKRVESDLPPLQRVTITAKERPLKEILAELQRQAGFPLEFADLKDKPISVDVRNVSPFQATLEVCKAAGLGFGVSYGKSANFPAIAFKADGYADAPRFLSSHFMLEVVNVTLTRRSGTEATGTVTLKLTWPPGVMPEQGLLDVVTIADERGRPLFERPERAAYAASDYSVGFSGQYSYSTSARVEFKHPADDVEKIGSIRGSALLVFAGEDRYLTFEANEKGYGKKKEMAGVAAELRGVKVEGEVTIVTYAFQGWPQPAMTPSYRTLPRGLGVRSYLVTLEDGTAAVSNHGGTRHDGPWRVEELRFPNLKSKVASVSVLAETVFHRETFEFELKDISLPK